MKLPGVTLRVASDLATGTHVGDRLMLANQNQDLEELRQADIFCCPLSLQCFGDMRGLWGVIPFKSSFLDNCCRETSE